MRMHSHAQPVYTFVLLILAIQLRIMTTENFESSVTFSDLLVVFLTKFAQMRSWKQQIFRVSAPTNYKNWRFPFGEITGCFNTIWDIIFIVLVL